ncbi:MAG: hypothetical protein JXA24_03190 [Proteobacteria bacterium]|nr:hypothetical protein [Pseudomonadota bacterium]
MKERIFVLLLTTALIALPVMGTALGQESGADASSEPAAGCGRISLGGVSSDEAAVTDQAGAGSYMGTEGAYDDFEYEQQAADALNQQGAEGQEAAGQEIELYCEEQLNPDGTLTCYDANNQPIICTVEGEDILCPY